MAPPPMISSINIFPMRNIIHGPYGSFKKSLGQLSNDPSPGYTNGYQTCEQTIQMHRKKAMKEEKAVFFSPVVILTIEKKIFLQQK